jgi:hypothetical protein
MRKFILKASIFAIFAAFISYGSSCFADTCSDLEYLGYSNDITSEIRKCLKDSQGDELCSIKRKSNTEYDCNPKTEADYTQEQLYELGKTRGFHPNIPSNSGQIKNEVDNFWAKMSPDYKGNKVSSIIKQQIFVEMKQALESANYKVIRLEILDLPEGNESNKVRAVVRVTRSIKTKNSYKEIQANLKEIKALCNVAANINGHQYLSELTTFVAENPNNKYYYEKTILNY